MSSGFTVDDLDVVAQAAASRKIHVHRVDMPTGTARVVPTPARVRAPIARTPCAVDGERRTSCAVFRRTRGTSTPTSRGTRLAPATDHERTKTATLLSVRHRRVRARAAGPAPRRRRHL